MRYWAAQGFRWFKVYTHITTPVLEAIVDEAHKQQARVTGHLQSVSCAEAAEAGIDNIEHSWFSCLIDLRPSGAGDSRDARVNELIPKLVKAHVTLTATPVDWVRSLSERELDVLHPAARESYLKMRALAGKPGAPPAPPRGEGPLSLRFVKAGGRLVLGSDPCCGMSLPGFASCERQLLQRANEERMKYASFGSCSLAILLSLDSGWVPPVRAPAAPVSRDDVDTYIDGEMRPRGIPVLP